MQKTHPITYCIKKNLGDVTEKADKSVTTTYEIAYMNEVHKDTLKEHFADDEVPTEAIEIDVDGGENGVELMKKVVKFNEYHLNNPLMNIPRPLKVSDGGLVKILGGENAFDWTFLADTPVTECRVLLEFANYLDNEQLADIAAAHIADRVIGKTPEEVAKLVGLEALPPQAELKKAEDMIREKHPLMDVPPAEKPAEEAAEVPAGAVEEMEE